LTPIRHISLDVWKTLIEPNPAFADARNRFLVAELSLPLTTIVPVYRAVKDGADRMANSKASAFARGRSTISCWRS
jgi:hypothetical protein